MENYYELLNVDFSATNREIKRAYRKKVVRFNNREMNEEEKDYVKRLKSAVYVLVDSNLRKLYNKKFFDLGNQQKNIQPQINHGQANQHQINQPESFTPMDNSFNNNSNVSNNFNLMKKDEFNQDKNKSIHDRIFDLQDLYNLKPKNIEYENQFLQNVRKNSQQNV